ncbi:hypothetical protein [[Pseudomonas] boreopolis]|uniref:hypothetical protein n=1 Tax=Xanthomonas boreopolis TaxID=86183 RepID=UPI003D9B7537
MKITRAVARRIACARMPPPASGALPQPPARSRRDIGRARGEGIFHADVCRLIESRIRHEIRVFVLCSTWPAARVSRSFRGMLPRVFHCLLVFMLVMALVPATTFAGECQGVLAEPDSPANHDQACAPEDPEPAADEAMLSRAPFQSHRPHATLSGTRLLEPPGSAWPEPLHRPPIGAR